MAVQRGQIFYIDYAGYTTGSEQQAGRPAIIVSNDINNRNSQTVEVVYLTTQPKNDLPTHTTIRSSTRTSTALCEQINTVSIDRVGNYVGECTPEEMAMVDACLLISLGLKTTIEEPDEEPETITECPPSTDVENTEHTITKLKAQLETYKELYNDLLKKIIK